MKLKEPKCENYERDKTNLAGKICHLDMQTNEEIKKEFEKSFNSQHGNNFHALANDGKRSNNCDICEEDRRLNPKGYYLTFLSEQKCYWNRKLMDDIADWWLNKMNLQKQQMIEKINPVEIAERIVIEYANISGREDEYRAYVRQASIKILTDYENLIKE